MSQWQSCLSLEYFSQNSRRKFSTFRRYKGYLYWCVYGMRRVSFSQIEWTGNLASRLDWVASPSRELTEWPEWTFCPVVLQLTWLFSSSACFTRVHPLATCKPRDPIARFSREFLLSAQSWAFFHILSHTTLTWFSPKYMVSMCWITSKLIRNKTNKIVN